MTVVRPVFIIIWGSFGFMMASVVAMFYGVICLVLSDSYVIEFFILKLAGSVLKFTMFVDWISLMFFSVVAAISCSVIYYSGSYMAADLGMVRFICLVNLFVGSMFFMVFSLNMISILLGWDGLGLISYILVIYYNNSKSSGAGMITALSNRVGDSAILISIGSMVELGSWDFMNFSEVKEGVWSVLVVLAAMTKSAQIPFSAWLPAAMAAPTPISALVHSSTLVTAGVYLMIRFSPLLLMSNQFKVLFYLSLVTTLMASSSALFETDLKKIVALSTLSQLGIMMMSVSVGLVMLGYFHMLVHALFKALLFMCSGKIIHMASGAQDLRLLGAMTKSLPYSMVSMNMANLALCGVPFMAGFYSKDFIMETLLMLDSSLLDYILFSITVGLSASYSFRLVLMSMVFSGGRSSMTCSEEGDSIMMVSKIGLMFGAVAGGAIITCFMFDDVSYVVLPFMLKIMSFISVFTGLMFGVLLVLMSNYFKSMMMQYSSGVGVIMMWGLPCFSGAYLSHVLLGQGQIIKKMELGWGELGGGQGVSLGLGSLSSWVICTQLNTTKKFLMLFMTSLVFMAWGYCLLKF